MSDIVSTADLFDELGEAVHSLSMQFNDFGGVTGFSGFIRTVRCFQDNGLVKAMLSAPGNGDVLVIDGEGSLDTALMGDTVAALAVDNNWAGVLVYGAVRDRVALGTLPIGVKALGSNPAKSSNAGLGEADVPVVIGNVVFRPGAKIWCDADGVLVER